MKTIKPNLSFFSVYPLSIKKQVHQLIAWGYEDSRSKIKSDNEEEPSISGFIVESIVDRLRAPNCPAWCKYYFVQEDRPERVQGRSGKSRLKPDIVIEANFDGRPEFVFEAKRLRKNGYGVARYVGPAGMGCFVSGLYAARYGETTMLGYVQSGSLEHWKDEIKNAINKSGTELELNSPQHEVEIIDALPFEWVSEHRREGIGRTVTIFHILLDFTL
jgi:hypothetical protein